MKKTTLHFVLFVFLSFFVQKNFAQDPNWTVNPSNYQHNMTFTSFLNVNGNPLIAANDKVAAFVNGEVRGIANVEYAANFDKYVAYLSVFGNSNGETINFKVYDSANDVVVSISKTETFIIDDAIGSIFQSYSIADPQLNDEATLINFDFKGVTPASKIISGNSINFILPSNTDITKLTPEYTTATNAKVFINRVQQFSGVTTQDFSNKITYTVVSENEENALEYKINVTEAVNENETSTIISSSETDNVKTLPLTINVQFSNSISGFEIDDIQTSNAVVSKLTKIDNKHYTTEVVPIKEGDFSVFVKPGAVIDADNKPNTQSNFLSFNYDVTQPIISSLILENQSGNEFFTIIFDEEVLNIDITDFDLTGTLADIYFKSSLQQITSRIFRLNIFKTTIKEGNIFLKVKEDARISDVSGNLLIQQEIASYYLDNQVPVVPVLVDIIAECSVNIKETPKANDAVSGEITGTTTDNLTYNEQGEYIIMWIFDDGNGNVSTANQKVIINDITSPLVPTLTDVIAQCSLTLVAPKTTDNCAGTIDGTTTDPIFYDKIGEYTVNWIFNDGNGNTSSAFQKVIIDNSINPVAPILPDVLGECSATIIDIPETQGNGCSGTVFATTTDTLTYSQQGEYIVNWSFDYGGGVILNSSQKVIVKDTIAPIAPILQDILGECSVTIIDIPTTTDNCSDIITGTTTDNLTYNQEGEFNITWIFDDENGNTSIAIQRVIVEDTTAPVIPILQDILGECSVTITDIPTTIDNCSDIITGTTTDNLTYNQQGEFNITWTFDDKNGNISTANQKIIVRDTIDPIAKVKDVEIKLDSSGNALIKAADVDNGSSDNCQVENIQLSKTNFTVNDLGENNIVFTVRDSAGNIASTNVKITVLDDRLSIDNTNIENQLSLYPNPAKEFIFVKFPEGLEIVKHEIFTVNGKKVLEEKNNKSKIAITSLNSGIYFLKITSNRGVSIRKILKY